MCQFPVDMRLHTAETDLTVYKVARVERGEWRSAWPPSVRSKAFTHRQQHILKKGRTRGEDVHYEAGYRYDSPFSESIGLMCWSNVAAAWHYETFKLHPTIILRCTIPKGTRYIESQQKAMITTETLIVEGKHNYIHGAREVHR